MRIVHVLTRYARGGTEVNVRHAIAWERERGHDVSLIVGGESLPDCVAALDLPVHVVSSLRRSLDPRHDWRAHRELRSLFRAVQPDVVHTHQSKAGALGRFVSAGTATARVHTVHMMSFGPSYGWRSPLFLAAERIAARRTDVLVAVGAQLREEFVSAGIGRREDFLVVRSPIDVDRFLGARAARGRHRAEVRAALCIAGDAPLVITAGALEDRKRHDHVVRALRPLLRAGTHLVVAGDGPLGPVLRDQADRDGVAHAVHLQGHVPDLERWLAASDVYVHAASAEGVPQVVVQALAAGLPVVACHTDGLREIDGAPITAVDPDEVDELRAAVQRIVAAPPPVLPAAALEPWTEAAIHRQLEELHLRIAAATSLPASVTR